jgi:hypothetical protein
LHYQTNLTNTLKSPHSATIANNLLDAIGGIYAVRLSKNPAITEDEDLSKQLDQLSREIFNHQMYVHLFNEWKIAFGNKDKSAGKYEAKVNISLQNGSEDDQDSKLEKPILTNSEEAEK